MARKKRKSNNKRKQGKKTGSEAAKKEHLTDPSSVVSSRDDKVSSHKTSPPSRTKADDLRMKEALAGLARSNYAPRYPYPAFWHPMATQHLIHQLTESRLKADAAFEKASTTGNFSEARYFYEKALQNSQRISLPQDRHCRSQLLFCRLHGQNDCETLRTAIREADELLRLVERDASKLEKQSDKVKPEEKKQNRQRRIEYMVAQVESECRLLNWKQCAERLRATCETDQPEYLANLHHYLHNLATNPRQLLFSSGHYGPKINSVPLTGLPPLNELRRFFGKDMTNASREATWCIEWKKLHKAIDSSETRVLLKKPSKRTLQFLHDCLDYNIRIKTIENELFFVRQEIAHLISQKIWDNFDVPPPPPPGTKSLDKALPLDHPMTPYLEVGAYCCNDGSEFVSATCLDGINHLSQMFEVNHRGDQPVLHAHLSLLTDNGFDLMNFLATEGMANAEPLLDTEGPIAQLPREMWGKFIDSRLRAHDDLDIKAAENLVPPQDATDDSKVLEKQLEKVMGKEDADKLAKVEIKLSLPVLEKYAQMMAEISTLDYPSLLLELVDPDDLVKVGVKVPWPEPTKTDQQDAAEPEAHQIEAVTAEPTPTTAKAEVPTADQSERWGAAPNEVIPLRALATKAEPKHTTSEEPAEEKSQDGPDEKKYEPIGLLAFIQSTTFDLRPSSEGPGEYDAKAVEERLKDLEKEVVQFQIDYKREVLKAVDDEHRASIKELMHTVQSKGLQLTKWLRGFVHYMIVRRRVEQELLDLSGCKSMPDTMKWFSDMTRRLVAGQCVLLRLMARTMMKRLGQAYQQHQKVQKKGAAEAPVEDETTPRVPEMPPLELILGHSVETCDERLNKARAVGRFANDVRNMLANDMRSAPPPKRRKTGTVGPSMEDKVKRWTKLCLDSAEVQQSADVAREASGCDSLNILYVKDVPLPTQLIRKATVSANFLADVDAVGLLQHLRASPRGRLAADHLTAAIIQGRLNLNMAAMWIGSSVDGRVTMVSYKSRSEGLGYWINNTPICENCGRRVGRFTCKRCFNASYCSCHCQKQHWKTHREECHTLSKYTQATETIRLDEPLWLERIECKVMTKINKAEEEAAAREAAARFAQEMQAEADAAEAKETRKREEIAAKRRRRLEREQMRKERKRQKQRQKKAQRNARSEARKADEHRATEEAAKTILAAEPEVPEELNVVKPLKAVPPALPSPASDAEDAPAEAAPESDHEEAFALVTRNSSSDEDPQPSEVAQQLPAPQQPAEPEPALPECPPASPFRSNPPCPPASPHPSNPPCPPASPRKSNPVCPPASPEQSPRALRVPPGFEMMVPSRRGGVDARQRRQHEMVVAKLEMEGAKPGRTQRPQQMQDDAAYARRLQSHFEKEARYHAAPVEHSESQWETQSRKKRRAARNREGTKSRHTGCKLGREKGKRSYYDEQPEPNRRVLKPSTSEHHEPPRNRAPPRRLPGSKAKDSRRPAKPTKPPQPKRLQRAYIKPMPKGYTAWADVEDDLSWDKTGECKTSPTGSVIEITSDNDKSSSEKRATAPTQRLNATAKEFVPAPSSQQSEASYQPSQYPPAEGVLPQHGMVPAPIQVAGLPVPVVPHTPGQLISPEEFHAIVSQLPAEVSQSMFVPSPEFARFVGPVLFTPPGMTILPPAQIPLTAAQVDPNLPHTTARTPSQKSEVITFEIGGSGGARWDMGERTEQVKSDTGEWTEQVKYKLQAVT